MTSSKKSSAASPKAREDSYTVARRINYMMTLLKQHSKTRKLTVSKALEALETQGLEVSRRTVQRYIQDMMNHNSGIKTDDQSPPGYWYESTAKEDMLQLTRESAFAVCLAEAHLKHLLPSAELKHLKTIFEYTSSMLEKTPSAIRYKQLLKRIAIFPRGWQIVPPRITDGRVFDDVMSALAESKRLKLNYKTAKNKDASDRIIEPLGMVERSGVYYIVGTEISPDGELLNNGKAKNWALHRILSVETLTEFSYPKSFQISNHARDGHLNRIHSLHKQKVRLRFFGDAGAHLRDGESKVSEDQVIVTQNENMLEIECSVPDTDEFRWWILEKGSGCEVVSPKYLRDEIVTMLKKSLEIYEPSPIPKTG